MHDAFEPAEVTVERDNGRGVLEGEGGEVRVPDEVAAGPGPLE